MADFIHTNSWMVHRPADLKSLGRFEGIVLFDRPQRIPRQGASGLVTQVTTPTPWRPAFLWRPTRAIEVRNGGTIVEGWSWFRRVERRTHYGSGASEVLVEIRPRAKASNELVRG